MRGKTNSGGRGTNFPPRERSHKAGELNFPTGKLNQPIKKDADTGVFSFYIGRLELQYPHEADPAIVRIILRCKGRAEGATSHH